MTPELIEKCTWAANPDLASKYADDLTATMAEFDIDTPVRQAAFLAQVGHESGGLLYMHEIWGPTPTQLRYDPPGQLADNLGNYNKGDGFKYRGRGPIQITGGYNYRKIGTFMGLDLENEPSLLDSQLNACRSAGAFWKWKNCNALADAGDFIALTKRINGGLNGLADRQSRWVKAQMALNILPGDNHAA